MWVEELARSSTTTESYPFPFAGDELDYRPLLRAAIHDRVRGRDPAEIARAFQRGVSSGLRDAVLSICESQKIDTVALSGGVFQNELVLEDTAAMLGESVSIWTNHAVPPNDGGVSLGQAALAAFGRFVK